MNYPKAMLPTGRETATLLVLVCAFLLLTAQFVGLRGEHVLLAMLYVVLFLLRPVTRRLAVAMLPFALFGISYDWMRVVPNYEVNPIDTQPLYEAEKMLFGIQGEAGSMIPGEFFNQHNWKAADFMSGVFYLCWVPVPIAFGLWLYVRGQRDFYLRFAMAFLFVNLLGFCIYYIHPAAPPWYVIEHGFEADVNTPASIAGLARFEELLGVDVFTNIYGRNANIFAAVPSLHAAYMLIAFVYAVISRQNTFVKVLFAVITLGIWFTAVYTCHHYIIDVLLGIATALTGILLFEKGLLRNKAFARFVARYVEYISPDTTDGRD